MGEENRRPHAAHERAHLPDRTLVVEQQQVVADGRIPRRADEFGGGPRLAAAGGGGARGRHHAAAHVASREVADLDRPATPREEEQRAGGAELDAESSVAAGKKETNKVYQCKPGPWGTVQYYYIYLEAPESLVARFPMPNCPTR